MLHGQQVAHRWKNPRGCFVHLWHQQNAVGHAIGTKTRRGTREASQRIALSSQHACRDDTDRNRKHPRNRPKLSALGTQLNKAFPQPTVGVLSLVVWLALYRLYSTALSAVERVDKSAAMVSLVFALGTALGQCFYVDGSWDALAGDTVASIKGAVCVVGLWILFYVFVE